MIRIGKFRKFETVPQPVTDLINGDTEALDKRLAAAWHLNEAIELDQRTRLLPITIALMAEQETSVRWLVERGAELNPPDNCAFLTAVRYCDSHSLIRFLGRTWRQDE